MTWTLLDGGMGRELQRSGAPFRQPEWSALALIEAPDMVRAVHASDLAAGAEVITTNSYALVPFHIGAERFTAEAERLADRAGRLAREAAQGFPGARVAGSLPPLFGSYRPDLFDPAQAAALIAPLVAGLAPHIDLWLGETLSASAEARVVAAALPDASKPLWLSFTLHDEPDGSDDTPRLRSGEPVQDAVRLAAELGAERVLFNCSQPEVMAPALRAGRSVAGAPPLGVYANAFPPQPKDAAANEGLSPLREDLDPEGYLGWARRWLDCGASAIGGCCGIGPEHIAALAALKRG